MINDGRYEYVWNAFDQLTEVRTTAGTIVATYKYDENGRRIYSNVDRKETYYRYDGTSNRVLFEEDAKGEIIKAYTYDDNGHPLTMTYGGATYYYLTNYRGDVLALTDEIGTSVAEYTYDAWGNILSQKDLDNRAEVNLSEENPYRYAGYRYDEETKLYYLMARYYNPDTGVFMSLDPVRGDTMNPITMNGFNYANNNPVMNVDPDGELAWMIGSAIKGSLSALLPYVWSIFSKNGYNFKKTLSRINYKKASILALTGALTGIMGKGLTLALTNGNIKLIQRMFVEFQWELKSTLATQYANNNKINFGTAISSAATNVISGKLYVSNKILSIYKRKGKAYTIRYIKRL